MKRASVYFLADCRKVADPLGCCLGSHHEKGWVQGAVTPGNLNAGKPEAFLR